MIRDMSEKYALNYWVGSVLMLETCHVKVEYANLQIKIYTFLPAVVVLLSIPRTFNWTLN